MTEYYKTKLEEGLKYQDFITDILIDELGISLSSYSSKEYQYSKGENRQGFEIKFDDKYKETGNIYIEIKEKTKAENPNFISSGIYRIDNTWLYLIGNYSEVYIFSKKLLRMLHKSTNYRDVGNPTSRGFLIPSTDAEKYCIKKIDL